jgi:phage repressor protein C with HTH and peptisase S24 domain
LNNRIKILCAENGISVAELANKIDMKAHALRRYTRLRPDGQQEAQPSIKLAQLIADTLKVPIDKVVGIDLGTDTKIKTAQKMPLYGAAEGGIGFDITDVREPVDAIDTPSWLAAVPDAYAVYVSGTSMEPRFRPGEIVYVHPGRPHRKGDYVVVQLTAAGADHAIVKQFVEVTDKCIVLRQHKPDREVTRLRNEVTAIHTIVGSFFG